MVMGLRVRHDSRHFWRRPALRIINDHARMTVTHTPSGLPQSLAEHEIFAELDEAPIRPIQAVNPGSAQCPKAADTKTDAEVSGPIIRFELNASEPVGAADKFPPPVVAANKALVTPHIDFGIQTALNLEQREPIPKSICGVTSALFAATT